MEQPASQAARIEMRLDPRALTNPDLDLRYLIPDSIEQATSGRVTADGYDYEGEVPLLVLFLGAHIPTADAVGAIHDVMESTQFLGNDMRGAYELRVAPQ